ALAAEVLGRRRGQADHAAEVGLLPGRVGTVEERADPARARLQNAELQVRESVERPEGEHRQERLLGALPDEHVVVPLRLAAEAGEGEPRWHDVERLVGRMDGDGYAQLL